MGNLDVLWILIEIRVLVYINNFKNPNILLHLFIIYLNSKEYIYKYNRNRKWKEKYQKQKQTHINLYQDK